MSFPVPTVLDHPLAPLYRALGHRTWTRLGCLWIDVGRFSLVSVPCSDPITASLQEVEELLRTAGRLAAQFPSIIPTGVVTQAYWVHDHGYGPASQQRQFRQHVARGGNRCQVTAIEWRDLAEQGYPVLRDSLIRQGRQQQLTEASWRQCCAVAHDIPDLEATGCLVDGVLAAFLISWTWQRRCYGLLSFRWSAYDQARPSHVLVQEFTRRMMARADIDAVTLGRDMVPRQTSIADFKRHAGYREEPLSVAAVLHPGWRWLLASQRLRGSLHRLHRRSGQRWDVLENVELLDVAARSRLPGA